jgi:hypothetical protein
MSRNSAGTYSPPFPDVQTNTPISSTWANGTIDDLGNEITNSLSRTGFGGMLAPLRGIQGSAPLPAYAFTADNSSGMYLAAASDLRFVTNSTDRLRLTNTGVYILATVVSPLTVSTATTNTAGVTSTGNGTGAGVVATAGTASGAGGVIGLAKGAASTGGTALGLGGLFVGEGQTSVPSISTAAGAYGVGGPSNSVGNGGNGIVGAGGSPTVSGTGGAGVVGLGGAPTAGGGSGGNGLVGIGGAGNGAGAGGIGVMGTGGAGAAGGSFANGTAATASTRRTAIAATNGDISLDGVAAPTGTVAIKNVLTPKNFDKVTVSVRTTNGSGTIVIDDSFNVASVSATSTYLLITFAQAFATTAYTVTATSGDQVSTPMIAFWNTKATTSVRIAFWQVSGGAMTSINPTTTNVSVDVRISGVQ